MSFSPIPIFRNVDMEVEASTCGNAQSGNLSTGDRCQVPTFNNLSGITYSKSNSSQSWNDIITLPSGYSYYVLAGTRGGNTSDYSYSARVLIYDEDLSTDAGSRSYYTNASSSTAGGGATNMQVFTRLSSCIFLPNLASAKSLSLKVYFTNGPFAISNYNHWTIYRIPS